MLELERPAVYRKREVDIGTLLERSAVYRKREVDIGTLLETERPGVGCIKLLTTV